MLIVVCARPTPDDRRAIAAAVSAGTRDGNAGDFIVTGLLSRDGVIWLRKISWAMPWVVYLCRNVSRCGASFAACRGENRVMVVYLCGTLLA